MRKPPANTSSIRKVRKNIFSMFQVALQDLRQPLVTTRAPRVPCHVVFRLLTHRISQSKDIKCKDAGVPYFNCLYKTDVDYLVEEKPSKFRPEWKSCWSKINSLLQQCCWYETILFAISWTSLAFRLQQEVRSASSDGNGCKELSREMLKTYSCLLKILHERETDFSSDGVC